MLIEVSPNLGKISVRITAFRVRACSRFAQSVRSGVQSAFSIPQRKTPFAASSSAICPFKTSFSIESAFSMGERGSRSALGFFGFFRFSGLSSPLFVSLKNINAFFASNGSCLAHSASNLIRKRNGSRISPNRSEMRRFSRAEKPCCFASMRSLTGDNMSSASAAAAGISRYGNWRSFITSALVFAELLRFMQKDGIISIMR